MRRDGNEVTETDRRKLAEAENLRTLRANQRHYRKWAKIEGQRGRCRTCDRFYDPPTSQCPSCNEPLDYPYVRAVNQ